MHSLAVFGIAFLLALAAALYAICARAQHEENKQLARLRESPLYRELRGRLYCLRHMDIDEVRIECSGITVTSVCPAHIVLNFNFKQNGNSLRNDTFARLYAELIAQDFPVLTQKRIYHLHRYRVYRVNGKSERAYSFIMQRGYKDLLLAERSMMEARVY